MDVLKQIQSLFSSPEDAAQVCIYTTSSNGDCLFDSIRIVLYNETDLHRYDDCTFIRSVVARSILDPTNKKAVEALHHWHTLYQEFVKEKNLLQMNEYSFMKPSLEYVDWPLPYTVVKEISDCMMQPNEYWGEEYALRVLENQLRIQFIILKIIITASGKSSVFIHKPLSSDTLHVTHYVWLLLCKSHYQPISFQGRFIFPVKQVPVQLQTIFFNTVPK